MKVIDLLQRIANGEIDNKVKFSTFYEYCDIDTYAYRHDLDKNSLNEEIKMIDEIIEEDKKIEKIEYSIDKDGYLSVNDFREHLLQIINKINEIIDYINGGTNGK